MAYLLPQSNKKNERTNNTLKHLDSETQSAIVHDKDQELIHELKKILRRDCATENMSTWHDDYPHITNLLHNLIK